MNIFQTQIDEIEEKIAVNQALIDDPELGELAQAEIADLTAQKEALKASAAAINGDFQRSDDNDLPADVSQAACIIEIRGGAGGDEAKIWGEDLKRMYLRFADQLGLKTEFIDDSVIKVFGKTTSLTPPLADPETDPANPAAPLPLAAYAVFKYESGVHRVQRVPVTESQGRVHTSTASVAVFPEVPRSAVEIRDEDLDWQFMRASGAGGQNVNKVNSAVRLTHIPTGLVVVSRQERKQAQNRELALGLLRSQLWELQEEKRLQALGDARSAIGRAQRAEKIRTYNYPQNRVTDHRLNESWHNLEVIVEGNLTPIWESCYRYFEIGDQEESS